MALSAGSRIVPALWTPDEGEHRRQMATWIINANKEATFQANTSIEVFVGSAGAADFTTIGAALKFLSEKAPVYNVPNNVATITLLSGFVMREQILVHGINMGWTVIFASDSTVAVDTTSFVDTTQTFYGINAKPAFAVIQGGIGPRIGCKFDLQQNVTSSTDTDIHGLFVSGPGSGCHVMNFTRGFLNCPGAGIYANRGGVINAYGATVSGSNWGIYANRGRVNCHQVVADNCKVSNLLALYGGHIQAFNGSCLSAQANAVHASFGSYIGFDTGNASGAVNIGIWADDVSQIDAKNAIVDDCGLRNIYASGGSIINARSASCARAGSRNIFAFNASTINCEGAFATSASDRCVVASSGSTINANGANALKGATSASTDFTVTGGSIINANSGSGGTNVSQNTVTAGGIIFKV